MWPQLPASLNVESTQSAVGIMLGKSKEAEKHVATSVPLGFQDGGSFLVDTSHFENAEDIKCDDNGGWVNKMVVGSESCGQKIGTVSDIPVATEVIK